MKLGNKIIGKEVFIIAEGGVNHNGDMGMAKKIIDAAAEARADAVKFQTFITEDVVTKDTGKASYQKRTTGEEGNYFDMIKKLEFTEEEFAELKKYAESKNIMFMSTPAEIKSARLLKKLGVSIMKTDSANLTNLPYFKEIASYGLPMIVSTGMSDIAEIRDTMNIIKENGNPYVILLHCTSDYPPDASTVNLTAMDSMSKEFSVPIGYSDHTTGIEVSVAAVALGAVCIEKHLTLDKNLPGPDQEASIEPEEFKELVRQIRNVEKSLGDGIKKPTVQEKENAKVFKKSIIVNVDIKIGEQITEDKLIIKRPGTGLKAKEIPNIIGKIAKVDIKADSVFLMDMVE